jgi:hypothetical protein
MDPIELSIRGLVKVECEIKTETGDTLLIIVSGRTVYVPRDLLVEVYPTSNMPRKDSGYNGYIVVPRTWACEQDLPIDMESARHP